MKRNERVRKENERIKSIIPVTTVAELDEQLVKIQCSTPKKTETAELRFLRDQIQHRSNKKVPLTIKGRKRSTTELKEELVRLLVDDYDSYLNKKLQHKIQEDNVEEWYDGLVVGTSDVSLTIQYDGYDERFEWTYEQIFEDVQNGDLIWL